MRRVFMIGCLGILGLCVVCAGLGYFIGLPRVRDGLRDGVAEFGATEVAGVFATPANVTAGRYTLTEDDINVRIREENPDAQNIDNWIVDLTLTGYTIGFQTNGEDVTYSGNLAAENGRLRVVDPEADATFFEWFFSADAMGDALERAVNDWLAANNLQLTDVQLADGEITLVTEQG